MQFVLTSGFKWIYPKEFDLNKYTSNSSREFRYPKELSKSHNDYSLAPDKIAIKSEMLPNYQLKIADFFKYSYWQC